MLSTNLFPDLLRNAGGGIADLTRLAVQATNLRSGATGPHPGETADSHGPAVIVSPTLTDAAANAFSETTAEETTAPHEDLGSRGDAGEGLRILADATANTLVDEALSLARLRKTLKLYGDTGQLYSVQPNGNYQIKPEDVGGAEAFIADIQRRIDSNIAMRPELEANAERTKAAYSAYMAQAS